MKKIFSFLMVALFSASMSASTYVVAGQTEIMGSYWDASDANNTMTLVEDLYTLVKSDLTLAAGTYEYKVLKDGDWDVLNKNNRNVVIAEAGIYTITFTLDETTSEINAVPTKTGDAEVDDVAQLAGKFNGWNAADMTLSGDKASASISLVLERDSTYEFKTIINGGWRGNGSGFTREANAQAGLSGNTDNMYFTADWDGEYTFIWTFANDSLIILFPELPEITLEDGFYPIGLNGHWTIYDINPAHKFVANAEAAPGVEEYILRDITLVEGQSFKIIEVENKALIDVWYGTTEGANYDVTAEVAGVRDIYFRPQPNENWGNGHIYVNWDIEPTAIDNTAVEAKAVKSLENGMLIIIKNGVRYNVLGTIVR